MEFNNHKITEAVCAFRFSPGKPWDIIYLLEYYNLIKNDGFTVKNEMKAVELSFEIKGDQQPKSNFSHGETQMVFKTADGKQAILMGSNYISFHTLNHYPGWEGFKKMISEFYGKYLLLGLDGKLLNAQMIYINNFNLEENKDLSDYLVFVPRMQQFGDGSEISHLFQSNYSIAPNKKLSLKTVLNVLPAKTKRLIFESNCIASKIDIKDEWENLADDAHNAARNAFIKVASEYFKNLIK